MDPGALPPELQDPTDIEEMLIVRACPIKKKQGGQWGYRGHVLNLLQDVQGFLTSFHVILHKFKFKLIYSHLFNHNTTTIRKKKEVKIQLTTH